jgi:hypothetical protein
MDKKLSIVILSVLYVFTFPILVADEIEGETLEALSTKKVIELLPSDFPLQQYQTFLKRCNETFTLVFSCDDQKLASHPAVLKKEFTLNKENDILLKYQFTRVDGMQLKKSIPWSLNMIEISWGNDIYLPLNEKTLEFSVSSMRKCEHLVRCAFSKNMEFFAYQENQIPNEEFGFSYSYWKDKKKYFQSIDFNKNIIREVIINQTNQIIEDKTKKRNTYEDYRHKKIKNQNDSYSNTLFSLNDLKSIKLSKELHSQKFKDIIEELNTKILSIKNRKRSDILQHSVFNEKASDTIMIVSFRWKPDKTLHVNVEQVYENNQADHVSYEICFQENGYPKRYRLGNIPTIKNLIKKSKYTGIEILFHPTGYPECYQSFSNGQINVPIIRWDEQGNTIFEK